jgi:hypothetical protein
VLITAPSYQLVELISIAFVAVAGGIAALSIAYSIARFGITTSRIVPEILNTRLELLELEKRKLALPENRRKATTTRAVDLFEARTGIDVSHSAQQLMEDLTSAIEFDPHPSWPRDQSVLSRFAHSAFVADLLQTIAKEEHVEHMVTTFDIVHFLSRHLDSLCPIQKE